MLENILVIVLSFFAVIGFIESIMTLLETVSTLKYKDIQSVCLTVELRGNISDVDFLLSTLLLQAGRIGYENAKTKVCIKNSGLDESTYSQIYAFCLENDNIMLEN